MQACAGETPDKLPGVDGTSPSDVDPFIRFGIAIRQEYGADEAMYQNIMMRCFALMAALNSSELAFREHSTLFRYAYRNLRPYV